MRSATWRVCDSAAPIDVLLAPASTPVTSMVGDAARALVTTNSMSPLGTNAPSGPNTLFHCGTWIQPPAMIALSGPPPGTAGSTTTTEVLIGLGSPMNAGAYTS